MKRASLSGIALATTAIVFLIPSLASATENAEQSTYVEQAEGICQSYAVKLSQQLSLRPGYNAMKLGPPTLTSWGERYIRDGRDLRTAGIELETVRRPRTDKSALVKWLSEVKAVSSLLKEIGKALKLEDAHKAAQLETNASRDARLANRIVARFHFHYCRMHTESLGWRESIRAQPDLSG